MNFKLLSITLIFVLLSSINGKAQNILQLTNLTTGKKLVLKEGYRVSYSTLGSNQKIGIIQSIKETTIGISEKEFPLTDITSIGRKRKGSGFVSFICGVAGAGIIIGGIQSANYDPCPSCTDEGSTGEGWTAVEIGLGAALIGLGISTGVRNSPKDVTEKWKLEVIKQP